ncbi:MAG: hypothetical protein F6K29_10690 [Okeania sp. SIO2G5]|nr:hypothetical protein [Okeania sp. SIO2G5]
MVIANTTTPLKIRFKKPLKNIDKTSEKGLTRISGHIPKHNLALGWAVEFRASDRDSTALAELEMQEFSRAIIL